MGTKARGMTAAVVGHGKARAQTAHDMETPGRALVRQRKEEAWQAASRALHPQRCEYPVPVSVAAKRSEALQLCSDGDPPLPPVPSLPLSSPPLNLEAHLPPSHLPEQVPVPLAQPQSLCARSLLRQGLVRLREGSLGSCGP